MNWWIVLALVAVMLVLRWRRAGMLAWAAVWFFGLCAEDLDIETARPDHALESIGDAAIRIGDISHAGRRQQRAQTIDQRRLIHQLVQHIRRQNAVKVPVLRRMMPVQRFEFDGIDRVQLRVVPGEGEGRRFVVRRRHLPTDRSQGNRHKPQAAP